MPSTLHDTQEVGGSSPLSPTESPFRVAYFVMVTTGAMRSPRDLGAALHKDPCT